MTPKTPLPDVPDGTEAIPPEEPKDGTTRLSVAIHRNIGTLESDAAKLEKSIESKTIELAATRKQLVLMREHILPRIVAQDADVVLTREMVDEQLKLPDEEPIPGTTPREPTLGPTSRQTPRYDHKTGLPKAMANA